jgi:predicted ribosome quality control (RQC) complex YloA/Tae2 family protein
MKNLIEIIENNKLYFIFIGKNARENWNLIEKSDPDDYWFHIENIPSAHIIVRKMDYSDTSDLPKTICDYCKKTLIATNSHCKTLRNPKIIMTKIENIEKGKTVGSVKILSDDYTIF